MVKVELERVGQTSAFDAKDADGHRVKIDTSPDGGGTGYGARPMQLLLMGLGGCSGIDVLSILKKQRQEVEDLTVSIEAGRETGKEPTLWTDIAIVFNIKGKVEREKAEKACALSMEKYCSVAETLRRAGSVISWKVIIS